MATKVKLRKKKISGNRQSLYLDFYPAILNLKTGLTTRRQFLGLYVFDKPKNPIEKQHNKDTQVLAEQLRQKRDNELNKPEVYSAFEREQLAKRKRGEKSFIDYFQMMISSRKGTNHENWTSASHYLTDYTNGQLRFSELNESFCNGFREYLLKAPSRKSNKTQLAQNSAVSYFNKFKAALKQAYKDGFIEIDLNARVPTIRQKESKRNFLTMEELNTLARTECPLPYLKRAALFSSLTGLRFSDIQELTWGKIEFIRGDGYVLHFTQKKTKGIEMLHFSEQAYKLLGLPGEADQKVFEELKYSAWLNNHLSKWIRNAGITKDITFHCFRHTYATLQLSKGTSIYVVSKMLGHRELKTTQVYAKIIDETKREAAGKIVLDL